MKLKRSRLIGALGVSALLALSVTACGSDEDSAAAPSADESVLGTPDAATGPPVVIGFIGDGKTEQTDFLDEIKAARAAAEYANNYLGGINGHRIELKTCESGLTPAGGTDCANQMVQAGAVAVVEGVNNPVDATIDTLSAAGIPMFLKGGSTEKSLQTPGVYSFHNGLATFGVAAVQAQDAEVSKSAIITAAIPAAEGAANGIGKLVFGNADVPVDVVPIPLGTPDATPQITTASNDGAEAFLVLGADAFCISALKAIRTVKPDAPITIPDRCITEGTGSSIPNGYEGMSVATSGDYNPETEDAKLFIAALAKYGDGATFGPVAGFGWVPMISLVQALNAVDNVELTPEGILAAVQSAPPLPLPLGAGVTYQCNGEQMPVSAYLCGSDGIVATASADGELSDFRKVAIDPALFTPPGS